MDEHDGYETTAEILMDLGLDEEAPSTCPKTGKPIVDDEGNLLDCGNCQDCGELPF